MGSGENGVTAWLVLRRSQNNGVNRGNLTGCWVIERGGGKANAEEGSYGRGIIKKGRCSTKNYQGGLTQHEDGH